MAKTVLLTGFIPRFEEVSDNAVAIRDESTRQGWYRNTGKTITVEVWEFEFNAAPVDAA